MAAPLLFTCDELARLHLWVSQDTESCRVEIHSTSGMPYLMYVRERVEIGVVLLEKADNTVPSLARHITDCRAF